MCECSKGYTCPQHVARVNAAGVAKQRKPKGMTIRQAVQVMRANRGTRKFFARNEETKKAARILMGAYYSSGERGCPSLQQIVDRFSVTVAAPKTAKDNDYNIHANSAGYFVAHRKAGGIICYVAKDGLERTSCARNNLDGSGGYFKSRQDAEAAIAAHKNKHLDFNIGDTVQAIANPGRGITNEGYFTVGKKFVIEEIAHAHGTIRLAGKDGYWDKSRFELVTPAVAQDNKWEKLVRELPMRSFTIERQTFAAAANRLLRNVSTTDIAEKLKDSGFKDVRPEHIHLTGPISEIGYYKVPIKFNEFSKAEISLWIVPL